MIYNTQKKSIEEPLDTWPQVEKIKQTEETSEQGEMLEKIDNHNTSSHQISDI